MRKTVRNDFFLRIMTWQQKGIEEAVQVCNMWFQFLPLGAAASHIDERTECSPSKLSALWRQSRETHIFPTLNNARARGAFRGGGRSIDRSFGAIWESGGGRSHEWRWRGLKEEEEQGGE